MDGLVTFLGGFPVPHVRKTKRRPSVSRKLKIAMLVCLVLASALVLGALFVVQQERLARGAAEAAQFTPAPIPSATPITRVGVIGDSYTGGSDMGGVDEAGWPGLVEKQLTSDERRIAITATGLGGSGYVTPGPLDRTFDSAVEESVEPSTEVVAIFGSINDMPRPVDDITDAANATIDQVAAIAPDAELLIIGPAWTSEDVPDELLAIRDTLASVAESRGATFLDPIADEWFFDSPELIGSDDVHPTDEGHAYMAERIAPALEALLAD